MDAAGVNTLVELVGDDAQVSVLHDDVAWDGREDLLAIFVPATGKPQRRACLPRTTLLTFNLLIINTPAQNKARLYLKPHARSTNVFLNQSRGTAGLHHFKIRLD